MVAFLGYALWVTLKHLLKRRPATEPRPTVSGVDNAKPLSAMRGAHFTFYSAERRHCPAHYGRP
jgi:hypothetical protein